MSTRKQDMTDDRNNLFITDDSIEQQVARHMAHLLNEHAQHLSPAQEQHLQSARENAVNYLAQKQAQMQPSGGAASYGGVLRWFGSHFGQQHRIASTALVVLVMLLTILAIQRYEQTNHLEDSDAFLLASELPPEAYADKGFDVWLDTN